MGLTCDELLIPFFETGRSIWPVSIGTVAVELDMQSLSIGQLNWFELDVFLVSGTLCQLLRLSRWDNMFGATLVPGGGMSVAISISTLHSIPICSRFT